MFYGKGDANLSGCSSISCVWLFKLQNFIEISAWEMTLDDELKAMEDELKLMEDR